MIQVTLIDKNPARNKAREILGIPERPTHIIGNFPGVFFAYNALFDAEANILAGMHLPINGPEDGSRDGWVPSPGNSMLYSDVELVST